jgi:hypothetical protein
MSRIQILDEKKYPMPMLNNNDRLDYYRWEHRATVGRNGKVYMVFVDNGLGPYLLPTSYIEEISAGSLLAIKDDNLWEELKRFATEMGFLEIQKPIMKDK